MVNKHRELVILSALTVLCCLFLQQSTAQGFMECYNYDKCVKVFVLPKPEGCSYDLSPTYINKTYICNQPNGVAANTTGVAAPVV